MVEKLRTSARTSTHKYLRTSVQESRRLRRTDQKAPLR